ncbi:LysE family translocator [Sphingobium yanoikuyae]|uniref:LysE family translocator n=1 Tax=Sphingobium yanoikuyae TaxID=13690 RepID=UPI0028B1CEBB|nr:LysE family translocator [Sphingobium yanoikuyae]
MWNDLFLVYGAYILTAGSPGPSTMGIMGIAMRHGRRPAAAMAAGVVTMSFAWGLIAVTGLAALVIRYALAILKFAGGLYLLWLSFKSARSAMQADAAPLVISAGEENLGAMYRRGVFMHVGNPKAILAWVALMSLGAGAHASTEHLVLAFGGCVLLGVLIFFGYAVLFSTLPMIKGYARARRWIDGALSTVFAGAGVRLLFGR